MSDSAVFQIPDEYRPGLEKLVLCEDKFIEKLFEAVKQSPPTFHIEDIVSFAIKEYKIDAIDSLEILNSLVSLYFLRETEQLSTEEMIDKISELLQEKSSFSEQQIHYFKKRLSVFLEINEPLEIISKGFDLKIEYENIFSKSRILTDMRPIFKSKIQAGIGGAIITHTLRLNFQTLSDSKEFFVNLSSGDIDTLISQLEEAKEKEQELKKLLKTSAIPYLDTYPKSDN